MKLLSLISLFLLISCASQAGLVCQPTGCNGEICSEKGKARISPCVVLPQHECVRKTKCEVQKTGKCGWTENEEYLACMKRFQPK
jgi:hypothetical protein